MSALVESRLGPYREIAEALGHPALGAMQGAMEEVFSAREEGLIVSLSSEERIDFPNLPVVSTKGVKVPFWLFPRIGALVPSRKSEVEAMEPIFRKMWEVGISFNKTTDGVTLRALRLKKRARLYFDFDRVSSQKARPDSRQLIFKEFSGAMPLETDEINSRQRESLGALMVLSDYPDYFDLAGKEGFVVAHTSLGRSRIDWIALPGSFLRNLVLRPENCLEESLYVLSASEIRALLGGTKVEEGSEKIDLPVLVY
jgi:hypothetical protein